MLVLAKVDLATKEGNGKGCLIRVSGNGGGKMIHILLAKTIALYMGFFMVEVRESGFE